MRRNCIILIILLFLLTGCYEKDDDNSDSRDINRVITNVLESDTWKCVVNKEFSNLDVWAGSGLYFYEEEGNAYCTFMIYGSGVRVAGHYKTLVNINEEGTIIVSLPQRYAKGHLSQTETEKIELVEVELIVGENSVVLGDYEFEINSDINNHQYIIQ